MATIYRMKNPELSLTFGVHSRTNLLIAVKLFSCTLGRDVGEWEIIIDEK